jgi:hypothetical protein
MPLLAAVGIMLLGLLLLCALAAVQMFTDVYHNVCMGPDPRTGQVGCCPQLRWLCAEHLAAVNVFRDVIKLSASVSGQESVHIVHGRW